MAMRRRFYESASRRMVSQRNVWRSFHCILAYSVHSPLHRHFYSHSLNCIQRKKIRRKCRLTIYCLFHLMALFFLQLEKRIVFFPTYIHTQNEISTEFRCNISSSNERQTLQLFISKSGKLRWRNVSGSNEIQLNTITESHSDFHYFIESTVIRSIKRASKNRVKMFEFQHSHQLSNIYLSLSLSVFG